jgi:DNA-directed RNA polymerase specialized sigma24 family protein
MNGLKVFIDRYYPMVRTAAARLTGSRDPGEIDDITEDVLAELWERRQEFAGEPIPGVHIYKILLEHVFASLKERKQEERIRFLQKTLLIDPLLYASKLGL